MFRHSCVELVRNIEKYPYVRKLDASSKAQLLDRMLGAMACAGYDATYLPSYVAARERMERYCVCRPLMSMVREESDPAFLLFQDGMRTAMLLGGDHLLLSASGPTETLDTQYRSAVEVSDALEKILPFQRYRDFRYLSSMIALCGNGMVVDILVHVPALFHQGRLGMMSSKLRSYPGAMLIPYHPMMPKTGFALVRVVSKTDPEEDVRYAKNMASELEVMEKTEREAIAESSTFAAFLKGRFAMLRKKERLPYDMILAALDAAVLGSYLGWHALDVSAANALFQEAHMLHAKRNIRSEEQREALERGYFTRWMEVLGDDAKSQEF